MNDMSPGIGHNVGTTEARLQSIAARVERLEAERAVLGEDIKEVYIEAKSAGFDVKALRRVISLKKMDHAKLQELDSFMDLYRRVLGV